jgi:uncharacterized protein (DUF885 family)
MNDPKPEHRISNLEKEFMHLGSRIEEMASDTAESLNALQQDLTLNVTVLRDDTQLVRDDLKQGFAQAHAYIQENIATKDDIRRIEATQEQILKLLQEKSGK